VFVSVCLPQAGVLSKWLCLIDLAHFWHTGCTCFILQCVEREFAYLEKQGCSRTLLLTSSGLNKYTMASLFVNLIWLTSVTSLSH